MSLGGVAPSSRGGSSMVCCPTCDLPAIVEDRFALPSTNGPVEHLRILCINRHTYLLLADHIGQVTLRGSRRNDAS